MRVLLLACLFAVTAVAQRDGFSVNEQGGVWFLTLRIPLAAPAGSNLGLYSYSAAGLSPVAKPKDQFSNLILPAVSSDATRVSWTERTDAITHAGQRVPTVYAGTVVLRERYSVGTIVHPGYVGISRNGDWAVWSNPDVYALGSLWLNFRTGKETLLPGVMLSVESVAADGSALRPLQDSVEVYTPSGVVERIATDFIPSQALISADTRRLLINSVRALFLYDRDLREWTTLANDCDFCYIRALSPNGARVAHLNDSLRKEIRLVDTREGTTTAIPLVNDRVTNLQFSDDGSVLWVMTSGLALLRIEVATGEMTTAMPASPEFAFKEYAAAGSRFRIDGDGLSNVSLSLMGRPVEIMDRGPGWLQVKLPADLPLVCAQWSVESPGALFLPSSARVCLFPRLPQFLKLGDLGESDPLWMPRNVTFGASDGWLINPERPAVPGEELLIWMTGLNDDTGALRWSIRPFADNGLGQELTIDGVAPDPIRPGWWIARLRLPASTPPGDTYIFCRSVDLPTQIGYALLPVISAGSPNIESSK